MLFLWVRIGYVGLYWHSWHQSTAILKLSWAVTMLSVRWVTTKFSGPRWFGLNQYFFSDPQMAISPQLRPFPLPLRCPYPVLASQFGECCHDSGHLEDPVQKYAGGTCKRSNLWTEISGGLSSTVSPYENQFKRH